MMQGGSLLWCAHHFAFFEDALNAFGATILVDERRRWPIGYRDTCSASFFTSSWSRTYGWCCRTFSGNSGQAVASRVGQHWGFG